MLGHKMKNNCKGEPPVRPYKGQSQGLPLHLGNLEIQ